MVLKSLDTQICYYDEPIGHKNRTSIAETVRAGIGAITSNGGGYSNPVELYIGHATSCDAPTYSSTELAR